MQAYLHVGAHKTGTSALQRILARQSASIVTPSQYRGSDFDRRLRRGAVDADAFIKNFARGDTLTVSEERLLGPPFVERRFYPGVDPLSDLIGQLKARGWRVRVLLTIRKHFRFLRSWYFQVAGYGDFSGGFLDYIENALPEDFDWKHVIERIAASGVVPTVIPHEKMTTAPAEFAADVNAFFDRSLVQPSDLEVSVNRSLDAKGVAIMRAVADLPEACKGPVREFVRKTRAFRSQDRPCATTPIIETLLADAFEQRDRAMLPYLRPDDRQYWNRRA